MLTDKLDEIEARAAQARPTPPVRRVRVRRHGRLYSVTFWRWCTFGASGLAAVLALYVAGTALRPPPPSPPAARYVAVLDRGEASPALIVTVDPGAGRMTIRPLALAAAGDHALQLWLVEGQNRPPRSLGLLDSEQSTALKLPAQVKAAVEPSAALAVSLEPPGGSPTGKPTGPMIYQGPLLALRE